MKKALLLLIVALSAMGQTACTDSESLFGMSNSSNSATGDFPGCTGGGGIDSSRILINFAFPSGATQMSILRNGVLIYSTSNTAANSYIDFGLNEGQTYSYTCEATIAAAVKQGYNVLNASTLSFNAPVFSGISSAVALGPTSVQVNWTPANASGVAAATYKIYANAGTTVNWALPAKQTLSSTSLSTVLTGLGDELPYSFGVRACSAAGNCDANTVEVDVTMTDGGYPTTPGITAASTSNGQVVLTAPWQESYGAVLKRKIYQKTGGPATLNLADYTLVQTKFIVDLSQPDTTLYVSGVAENTTYHYILVDEDPTGNSTPSTNYVARTVSTGDLTAPTFAGISTLVLGTDKEHELTLTFNAIPREGMGEGTGTTSASYYLIYTTSAAYGSSPADPCTSGTLYGGAPISTNPYDPAANPNAITLTGLNPRTTYSVCMKAQDLAGNTSSTASYLTRTTIDVTPPSFDGIQSVGFDPNIASVVLSWNPSTSSDIKEYKVRLWLNNADPSLSNPIAEASFTKAHSGFPLGWNVANSDYAFGDNMTIYALVNACDDAAALPGGAQNCTTYAVATAKNKALPDITPPPGFNGIKGQADQISTVEGQVTVTWFTPADLSDYMGFKIYHKNPDNSLMFLKDCPCPGGYGACVAPADMSCTVSGLDPFRTYNLHVRAYDATGNITQLNPAVYTTSKRIADTTAPTFSSGLAAGAPPAYEFTWSSATDNQYPTEPGAIINYEVWQKVGSNFATPTNPSLDGTLKGTTTSLSFTDGGFIDATAYYYTICAVDASNNKNCDGFTITFTTGDLTPPIASNFKSPEKEVDVKNRIKKWSLTWAMSDNATTNPNLRVKIYATYTDTPGTATTSDAVIFDSSGVTTATNIAGPVNVDKYANYLLEVKDEAGNTATASTRVYSENVVAITSIKKNEGLWNDSKWVIINGTGFSEGSVNGIGSSSSFTVNNNACVDSYWVDEERFACKIPAIGSATTVSVDVKVTNPDGSSHTLANAYTYKASNPGDWCDDPSVFEGPDFPNQASASGTSSISPWIVCTPTQFMAMINHSGRHFKLGSNIDLQGQSTGGIVVASLDGDGYAVMNYSGTQGLFGALVTVGGFLKNLNGLNITVNGNTAGDGTGGLINRVQPVTGSFLVDNIFINGSLTTSDVQHIGGLIGFTNGRVLVSNIKSKMNVTASRTTSGANYVGGLVGQLAGHAYNVHVEANVTTADFHTVGGVFGYFAWGSNVENCPTWCGVRNASFNGAVNASGPLFGFGSSVGGIAGRFLGQGDMNGKGLYDATVSGSVTGLNTVGGVVGYSGENMSAFNISSTADVTATAASATAGGLLAYWRNTISGSQVRLENCYSGGSVMNNAGTYTGGLVGNSTAMAGATYYIGDCYSTATVHGNLWVGGAGMYNDGMTLRRVYVSGLLSSNTPANVFGLYYTVTGTVNAYDSFWDMETTGQVNSSGGTGKTTAQMKTAATYTNWDFTNKWSIASPDGTDYPKLNFYKEVPYTVAADNLRAWYDASYIQGVANGAIIPYWMDRSGNGRTLNTISGNATYSINGGPNSKPTVTFAAGATARRSDNNLLPSSSTGYTVFTVFKNDQPTFRGTAIRLSTETAGRTTLFSLGFDHTTVTTIPAMADSAGTNTSVPIADALNTGFSLVEMRRNGLDWYVYRNNTLESNVTGSWSGIDAGNYSLTLGATYGTNLCGASTLCNPLAHKMAEVLIYDKSLTPAECDSIRTYLNDKYALW